MREKHLKPTRLVRITTEKEMQECQEISQELFGVGRTTVKDRMKIVAKNPETYHLLLDDNLQAAVGYVALMPLKIGTLDKILSQEIPVQINVSDIETFEKPEEIDLYLHAIGVKPGFNIAEKHMYGARLIRCLIETITGLGTRGIVIKTIAARSNTLDGIRLMKQMGFTEIEPLTPERRTFLIEVKNSDIPFVLKYKKALSEHSAC